MSHTTKYTPRRNKHESGVIPLVIVLALTAASTAVMGGAYFVNLFRDNGYLSLSKAKLNKNIENQGIYLDEAKAKNSSFDSNVVGTVILSDGSFSAYKVIDGEVADGGSQFVGTAKIAFLSGDQAFDDFNDGTIAPFYFKDGTKTVAQIVDKVVANLVLDDSTSYAIKILQGKIENGKLIGEFVGQTFDSGFIFAGIADETGKVNKIVVKTGAQKTTEVESLIAKNAVSLFQSVSGTASNMKVLGVSDYKPTGFNKPIYDNSKGTWIFAGGTLNGSVSSSPIQGVVNYIQSVAESISNGNGIYKQIVKEMSQGSGDTTNNIPDTSTTTLDLSQISLDSITGQVDSGKIAEGAVTISKLSSANSALNGNCLTYDSGSGQFKWGNCGNGGGGIITGVTAGEGLTGGGISGNLDLAVSLHAGGGLQASGSGVSLLRTCSANEILKWDGNSWICATDAGGAGGGISTLQVDDATIVSSATTIDFLGSDFNLTNSPSGEGNLSIDYTNSKIVRSDQTQSITGAWTFTNGLTLGTDAITDITGSGLSVTGGALTVSNLTTSNFTSNNVSQWTNNAGYLTGNQSISLGGDLSGTGTTNINATIGSGAVTLSKMANLVANSIIGNNTGSAATPIALTGAQVKTLLGISTSDVTGLGTIATQSAGNVFITGGNMSGLTSVGATTFTGALTGNASTATKLGTARTIAGTSFDGSANISLSNKFIVQGTSDSGLSGAQFLGSLGTGIVKNTTSTGVLSIAVANDFPTLNQNTTGTAANITGVLGISSFPAMSGDVTNTQGNLTTTIANGAVTLGKMANLAANSIIGNNSGSSATPIALTASQVKTLLGISTSDVSGLGTIATQSASNVFITGGNISGIVSLNGATISGGSMSGGSLSATAVNGITTGDIVLTTGSYSNPSWVTSLTPSKVLPDQTGQNGKVLGTNGSVLSWVTNSSGVAWGAITGTLSEQSDLNTALSGKLGTTLTSANIIVGNGSGVATGVSMGGDVTIDNTGATTIGSSKITLGKMANLAANSIIGNNTGLAATPIALTGSQVKTLLGIGTGDISGLGTIATQSAGNVFITGGQMSGLTSVAATTFTGALTGNADTATTATTANALANSDAAGQSAITAINSATTGTINTARLNSSVTIQGNTFNGISQLVKLDTSGNLPAINGAALTGLTKSQVGLTSVENTALSTWTGSTNLNTIANGTVTLSRMANLAVNSIIGNNTAGATTPIALTASQVKTLLGISTSDVSGLGTIATQSASNVFITGGQLSGLVTINGATISGGSLSATAVNGVTTADIALTSGSYNNPSWITALSPTKVLPDQTGQNGKVLSTNGSVLSWITNSSGVAWGAITGTLSDQTDLNTALGLKANTSSLGTISSQNANAINITGGTIAGLTGFSIRSSGTGAFDLTINNTENLTAGRALTITTGNAARTLTLTGDSSISGTNTGDNAANSNYASDYRAANFVAGTNYLAPTGSAASLTSFPTFNQNTTGTASNITGVLGATSFPAMSGDVTNTQGSLTTAIASGAVTLGKMANLAANSIIGNNTGSSATPIALTATQVKTLLGLGTIATQDASNVTITGGTVNGVAIGGSTAAAGAFTTLGSSGNTTLGDANSDTLTIKAGSSGTGISFFDSSFANCSALETVAGVLACGVDDTGAGGGVSTIKEGGTNIVTSAVALNFAAADFAITDQTLGVAGITIDYVNSKITRTDQSQTVTGTWSFGNLGIGSVTVPQGALSIANNGLAATGKSLVNLDQYEDQDIFTASASGSTKFVINKNGYIGIGTNNPQSELDIYGANPTLRLVQSGGDGVVSKISNMDGSEVDWWLINNSIVTNAIALNTDGINEYSSGAAGPLGSGGGGHEFYINQNAVMNINNSGRVGIGTNPSPVGLLNVNGKVTGKALIILDETGDQAIFTASASGQTKFTLARSGDLTLAGAISAPTSTNTINGIVINSGALSGATTLGLSGAITAATATNTINGIIINSGAVSGVTTLGASSTVTIGTGGNTYTLDPTSTSGMAYAGAVRPTRKETMAPEYQGAVLTGTGTGTMTSDFCDNNASNGITDVNTGDCNTNETHNFYKWTTSQGTAQTYSIFLRWRVPDNFPSDGFSAATNPVQVYGRRSDITNGSVKVYVYDTTGALNNTEGTEVGAAANTWNQGNISVSGGTWTPGSYMTIKIDVVAAASGGTSYAGEINLNYRSTN